MTKTMGCGIDKKEHDFLGHFTIYTGQKGQNMDFIGIKRRRIILKMLLQSRFYRQLLVIWIHGMNG
jgi:hypothetical protein